MRVSGLCSLLGGLYSLLGGTRGGTKQKWLLKRLSQPFGRFFKKNAHKPFAKPELDQTNTELPRVFFSGLRPSV
jgi:hypothetical protein